MKIRQILLFRLGKKTLVTIIEPLDRQLHTVTARPTQQFYLSVLICIKSNNSFVIYCIKII